MIRVLITGAGRGLGLEFTRRYLERGERVFAGTRRPGAARALQELKAAHPERLTILAQDVTEMDSIRHSHAVVRSEVDGLDLLINNAGVYSSRDKPGETHRSPEGLGQLNFEDALTVLRANAVAPLLVAQEYLDLLRAGRSPRIASISSGYGSVSRNTSGFPYYYSASKAALNMFMRSLAADAGKWGIITVLLDPGWVSTDMGGPNASLTPRQSVGGLVRVLDTLTPRQNGHFLDWRGGEQPW